MTETQCIRAAIVVAGLTVLLGAGSASAQNVGMAGHYHEAFGGVVNLPQNPPVTSCASGDADWATRNEARCMRRRHGVELGTSDAPFFTVPHHGVYGARIGTEPTSALPTGHPGGSRVPGMNPGDPFRVPAGLMAQRLGLQTGPVLNSDVWLLDTNLTFEAPGVARAKSPPSNTRVFRTNAWVGQDDGGSPPVARTAAAQTVTHVAGSETVTLTYTPGPNAFGGTMSALLSGERRIYIKSPALSGGLPPSLPPAIGSYTFGSLSSVEQAGAGWNYTLTGMQQAGHAKAFGVYPPSIIELMVAPDCGATPPPAPVGCNQIDFWSTPFPGQPSTTANTIAREFNGAPGVHFGRILPPASSTKHLFAWTTGTVQIRRVAIRSFATVTDTLTAKGYDTVTPSGLLRRVGLVAGAFTQRQLSTGGLDRLHPSLVGLDMKFAPEPGFSAGLALLLGSLAAGGGRGRSLSRSGARRKPPRDAAQPR